MRPLFRLDLTEDDKASEGSTDVIDEHARGEMVEHELDAFISKRHEQRVKTEGERAVEDAWRASERRQEQRRREGNRAGWMAHYRRLERGYLERAAECGQRANELERTA